MASQPIFLVSHATFCKWWQLRGLCSGIVLCIIIIAVGPLCRRLQRGRSVSAPNWWWEPHQLPKRNWYQWCRWHPRWWQSWKPVSHCRVPAWHDTHWRVWVSICEGEPLLWPQDYIWGICCYTGEEQSTRSCAEYTLHCLTMYIENGLFLCLKPMLLVNHTEFVASYWGP